MATLGANNFLDEGETPYETAEHEGKEHSEPDSAVAEDSEPEEGVEKGV